MGEMGGVEAEEEGERDEEGTVMRGTMRMCKRIIEHHKGTIGSNRQDSFALLPSQTFSDIYTYPGVFLRLHDWNWSPTEKVLPARGGGARWLSTPYAFLRGRSSLPNPSP